MVTTKFFSFVVDVGNLKQRDYETVASKRNGRSIGDIYRETAFAPSGYVQVLGRWKVFRSSARCIPRSNL